MSLWTQHSDCCGRVESSLSSQSSLLSFADVPLACIASLTALQDRTGLLGVIQFLRRLEHASGVQFIVITDLNIRLASVLI